jgi:hypothetical protein
MQSDRELVEKLHYYCPEEEQKQAIEEILQRENFDLSLLLHPYGVIYWKNAALVLSRMRHERLLPIMDGLFEWLQDLNCPGANIIRQTIAKFPKLVFMPYYEKAVNKAIKDNDYEWLGYLSWFIREDKANVKQDDFVDKYLYEQLYACKEDFWL